MKRLSFLLLLLLSIHTVNAQYSVSLIIERVNNHEFNPMNKDNSMTLDRIQNVTGIADLDDSDWKVRLMAVADLVKAGENGISDIKKGLLHPSIHVKQVCAMSLGILGKKGAAKELEELAKNDQNSMVRSQAVIALGQIESSESILILKDVLEKDSSRDVQHQCELAIYQIENKMGSTDKQRAAYLSLDESQFETVKQDSTAPDFILEDTDGKDWQISSFKNDKWVVLIWVFADWCPVCHGEFHDLMEMQDEFKKEDVQVFTLEIHDRYRGRVMVGKELEPSYWFARESFKEAYTDKIFWPHLLDRAGINAARYGADPLAYSVHAEYINRPTTVIIDKSGVVRFLYHGTYWGDRPTIEQTLEMIKTKDFSFKHPKRR